MDVERLGNSYSYHVGKAVRYIRENYKYPISLSSAAKYLKLNKCYFCNMFREETGQRFSDYLNGFRIFKSRELLLATDHSMVEIASMVGFNSQNYFNIAFKKYTGMSPLQYKNKKDLTA